MPNAFTIQQALDLALGHHQAERLGEAEAIYRQILAQQPRHADALQYLGLIAQQMGRNDIAVDLIMQAIALRPHDPAFHSNLCKMLTDNGQPDEAIAAGRRALELKPDLAVAHYNLGAALDWKGQRDEAIAEYRRALQLKPDCAEFHNNLGAALLNQGKSDEAIAAFRCALQFGPNFAEAHYNLSLAFYKQGQFDEAVAACRRALDLKPEFVEARTNLPKFVELARIERTEWIVVESSRVSNSPLHASLDTETVRPGHAYSAGTFRYFAELETDRFIRERYFPDFSHAGTMVEVGGATPDLISMSKHFRLNGWRTIVVEPNPQFVELHREQGNEVYAYACSDEDRDDVPFQVVYECNNRDYHSGEITAHSLSSLDVKEIHLRKGGYGSIDNVPHREIRVKVRKLDTILRELRVDRLDLVSIDVEGWELEVMRGFSPSLFKPKVIVIENVFHDPEYTRIMSLLGYRLDAWREQNYIYTPECPVASP